MDGHNPPSPNKKAVTVKIRPVDNFGDKQGVFRNKCV
jgi:hypothetical protein